MQCPVALANGLLAAPPGAAGEGTLSYLVGRIFWAVTAPSNLMLLLALLGLIAAWRGRRWGSWLLAVVMLGMLSVTALPVGLWPTAVLEDRFPPPPAYPERLDGIILLGGGIEVGVTTARGQPSFGDPGERYLALVELARRYPQAQVVFTGGSGLVSERMPEAEVVRLLGERLGFAPDRIIFERRARNTLDNALLSMDLVRPEPGQRWLLVTSAMHMPRAVGVFHEAGWPVIPWPVDYRSEQPWQLSSNLRLSRGLLALDDAAYEWLGLVYYRLLGHTGELFPGPGDRP